MMINDTINKTKERWQNCKSSHLQNQRWMELEDKLLDNYWTVGKRICWQGSICQCRYWWKSSHCYLFGIQSIPTTLILKNGKIIDVLIRALLKLQIENNLKAAISLPKQIVTSLYDWKEEKKSQMISNCGNDATLTPSSVWIFLIFVAYSRILASSLWTFAIL